jgi:3-phosphoshikimate 1-carboxyvinyltransferase
MPPSSSIDITPVTRPFTATVRVPGSKSLTNRALLLAALAHGETQLAGVLFADDTWQMINALQSLGYHLQLDQQLRRIRVVGGGREIPRAPRAGLTLNCGNSGTTIRFLAAMLALGEGDYILDGIARMRQRPIDQLVDQLGALGADIRYEMAKGFPPIRIRARGGGGLAGGGCQFSDAKSSQYISAILMAAPYANQDVIVNLLGPVTSEPYVLMTLRMMEQFGATAEIQDQGGTTASRAIRVPRAAYRPPIGRAEGYAIEPDASNASYFLAAAAIVPGSRVTVAGLGKNSLQGDIAFADVLAQMGAKVEWLPEGVTVSAPATPLAGIDLDMNHIPDMVQTLAVVALFAQGPTTIRNVGNLRIKETDRLSALASELRKLGAAVQTSEDSIRIAPPPQPNAGTIETYDDHRMAMAFAVAGLRVKGIRIHDTQCTTKTFPDFFQHLMAATNGKG